MYADDLCVIISSKRIGPIMPDIQECMRQFGLFYGLMINIGKCGIVIKGPLHVTDHALVEETKSGELFLGIAVCLHIKYPPPPLVVPHPLSFPGGGVTWSTQNFSLRLIVLLCG